jgi:hypothetical protein
VSRRRSRRLRRRSRGGRSSPARRRAERDASNGPTPEAVPALQSVQTFYQSLPHTSVTSDLSALAAQMISSGTFKTATVVPGGISATLPDGTLALVFADRAENLGGGTASVRRGARSAIRPRVQPLSPANSHEAAFLINTIPQSAFTPARQQAFSDAFSAVLGVASGYEADDLDVSLDNIVALGTGHPFDFLASRRTA